MKKRKTLPILLIFAGFAIAAVFLTAAGFSYAAIQESRDSFCASCHTQPETTYYERSTASAAVDMASAHTAKKVACIDCHSGSGIPGRLSAEMMGAWNAAHWYTGTAVQPAKLTMPIADSNCIKCHQEDVQRRGARERENHFHYFLTRWQARDANAGSCVSCHSGHATDGDASTRFMNEVKTQAVCEACHRALGEGGEGDRD
jgi:nitrate/TMAO reductase-like tetraheme cytochrome c subunit